MVNARLAVIAAIALGGVERVAAQPSPAPDDAPATGGAPQVPVLCDGRGCTDLDFAEFVRRVEAARESASGEAGQPESRRALFEALEQADPEWQVVSEPFGVAAKHFGGEDFLDSSIVLALPPWAHARTVDGMRLGFMTDATIEPAPVIELRAPTGVPRGAQADPDVPLVPGGPADDLSFLDVVLIGNAYRYHCSGILIAQDAVLTASHCAPATRVAVAHSFTQVYARVKVTATEHHPTLDAAVLRLDRSLPVPVRPRRKLGATPPRGPVGIVRIIGFGASDMRHPATFGVKRRRDAAVTGWGCDRGRARAAGCNPAAEMIVTAVGGGDTCTGDSGGPLLEPVGDEYHLLAITSRATASGGALCGRGGIYVRVDVLDPWLTSLVEKKRP